MTFLHLGLLWLLPLALLPVLLHLLTLQRLRTVELSTFRFLFDSYVQQRRRMQFLEALLAMLRTLFLLGLIAALCRPVLQHWNGLLGSGSGREVVMLMDCSASMNRVDAGQTAFKRAQDAAKTLAGQLKSDDRLTLIRVTGRPQEWLSRVSVDARAVQERIDTLQTSPARANFFAALSALFGTEAKRGVHPSVLIFTDGQSSGWKEIKAQGGDSLVPAGTSITVIQTGTLRDEVNVAVEGLAPGRQRAIVGLPIPLRAKVVNHSRQAVERVRLSIIVNDKQIRPPIEIARIEPGKAHIHVEQYEPSEPGSLKCRFEVEVKGGDAFPDDDRFLFALNVVPRIKVLVVNGNPSPDRFENETLYLRTALRPTSRTTEGPPPAGEKPSALRPSRDTLRSLDVDDIPESGLTAALLDGADVVVLANCGQLNPSHLIWLKDYVRAGGGLLIFPGDRVSPDYYNAYLFPVVGPKIETLVSSKFGPVEGDPDKPETFERLRDIDESHPALTIFGRKEAAFFRDVRIKRRFPLNVPTPPGNSFVLASLAGSGKAALVEGRLGDGKTIVAAFPVNAKWTNLPLRSEFLPLLMQLIKHVQRRPEVEALLVVPADGVAELNVAGAWAPVSGEVTREGTASAGPATWPLEFERSASRQVAHFDRTDQPGYYSADIRGGAGQTRGGQLAFAVNLSPDESDTARLTESDLRELLPSAEVTLIDATAEATTNRLTSSETEIWRPLIYLVLLVVLVEFLLSTIGGPKRLRYGKEGEGSVDRVESYNPVSLVSRMTGGGSAQK